MSKRQACREFGIHWDTLRKILAHPAPPGREVFLPLRQPPGEAQVDFGEALASIGDIAAVIDRLDLSRAPTAEVIRQWLLPPDRPELQTFRLAVIATCASPPAMFPRFDYFCPPGGHCMWGSRVKISLDRRARFK